MPDRADLKILSPAATAYLARRMSRRRFLAFCALAGIGFTSPAFLFGCSRDKSASVAQQDESLLGPQSAGTEGSDQYHFLRDVGRTFRGTKLRVVSEDTPPSKAVNALITEEFTPLTGIEVEWELLPLDRVLAKLTSDMTMQAGVHDLVYLDQAWVGNFFEHCITPEECMKNSELNYPDYNLADILQPLRDHIASYRRQLFAIPFDIPIFITMYRKDIFAELGLAVPVDLDSYLSVIQAINNDMAPQVYGTTGMWKAGHYGLHCLMTAWLWGHGGSVFGSDLSPTIADDRAHEAMEYMLRLGSYMPPGAMTWDWNGEARSFAQGQAGIYLSWGEFFPGFDDPQRSRIVGLAEAAVCPRPKMLRTAQRCGFGEVPGVGHQGGSSLALSRYSKHRDAAWILLQWATCADVTTRACLLGGGASPIRMSNYHDPRIRAKARVTTGTTRHFDVTLETILHHMGTEPHLPGWSGLATDVFATELGKMTTGQQSIHESLLNMSSAAKALVEKVLSAS